MSIGHNMSIIASDPPEKCLLARVFFWLIMENQLLIASTLSETLTKMDIYRAVASASVGLIF
jgi:hypothetical protein